MNVITYLTRILFDPGAIRALPEELGQLGAARPLVVTDGGIVEAGLLQPVLSAAGLADDTPIFKETPQNPTEAAARAARDDFHAAGCDSIIAVGGGSPLDLAKAVALLATHDEPLAQYAAIHGGLARIGANQPPVIAVPTTAGTGSEVGRAALITLEDGRKLGFISPHLIPNVAICDPELTLGLPPGLTAATGMDAVTHCVETFLSPRLNPPADSIALDGLSRAAKWLRRAVENGSDLEARGQMMMAALEGGLTFQKGLGAVHSMSHALGGRKTAPLHHGTLNAILLPHVLRFNAGHVGDKYEALAAAMGLARDADLAGHIERLNEELGLPRTLSGIGVTRAEVESLAQWAQEDHSTATNPRPMTSGDFAELFIKALD